MIRSLFLASALGLAGAIVAGTTHAVPRSENQESQVCAACEGPCLSITQSRPLQIDIENTCDHSMVAVFSWTWVGLQRYTVPARGHLTVRPPTIAGGYFVREERP
jgi:hypothetical protein